MYWVLCGNSKDNENLPITPLDNDCETKFKYTADGYILGTDKDSEDTIEILQLNIDELNKLRNKAIEPFISEEISEEDAKKFVDYYLQPHNGQYGEFYTTIQYLFD
ncbi:MAG: hypothetical protein LGB68_04130 [Sulfurovum sp.]|nr:hypothetical protein [Sulfurovum sp.]MCB4748580.1 hypothetical protein [Sulfurovum sp.]MCB4754681.1 hypothetical protein [Sulfurovum sp.]MCB4763208.1 hypothetical protein [Sulfurovum sp.]MCB4764281.1 hypothetical protein [Sulfurovum sp.]